MFCRVVRNVVCGDAWSSLVFLANVEISKIGLHELPGLLFLFGFGMGMMLEASIAVL